MASKVGLFIRPSGIFFAAEVSPICASTCSLLTSLEKQIGGSYPALIRASSEFADLTKE